MRAVGPELIIDSVDRVHRLDAAKSARANRNIITRLTHVVPNKTPTFHYVDSAWVTLIQHVIISSRAKFHMSETDVSCGDVTD